MFTSQMYRTPEGFELSRPLLMPDAKSFHDVLDYHGEWDSKAPASDRYAPRLIPQNQDVRDMAKRLGFTLQRAGNEVGPYCSIRTPERRHRGVQVIARDETMDVLANRIVTDDDTISFEAIVHPQNNRALIVAKHNQILGSHWLAYVDPETLPDYPFESRDAMFNAVCDGIRKDGGQPFVTYHKGYCMTVQDKASGYTAFIDVNGSIG